MIRKILCWMRTRTTCLIKGHPAIFVDQAYPESLLKKVWCPDCQRFWVWNRETNGMLPWDSDFEEMLQRMKEPGEK